MMKVGKHGNRKGQSTIEYLLILAVIIAAVVVAATNLIRPAVTRTMDSSQTAIQNAADQLSAKLR